MKTLTVYSTPDCTHCQQAKQYLTELSVPFDEINLYEDVASMEFIKQQGHRSVPQIYMGSTQFVSGWTELQNMPLPRIQERMRIQG